MFPDIMNDAVVRRHLCGNLSQKPGDVQCEFMKLNIRSANLLQAVLGRCTVHPGPRLQRCNPVMHLRGMRAAAGL